MVGVGRAGGNDDGFGFQGEGFFDGDFIVAADIHARPQIPQILDEVVGEAVVIVDEEDHGESYGARRQGMARGMRNGLLFVGCSI